MGECYNNREKIYALQIAKKPAPPSITTEDKGETITGKGEH